MGDGLNTLFWCEPWLEEGPLQFKFGRLFSLCLDKEGSVGDIVRWRNGEVEWYWRWRRGLFQWESQQLAELQAVVLQAELKGEGVDKWVWMRDNSGSYSVSSAYQWLGLSDISGSEAFFDKMWKGGTIKSKDVCVEISTRKNTITAKLG